MMHSVNVLGELRHETKVGEKKRGGLFVYQRVRESMKGEVILGEQVGEGYPGGETTMQRRSKGYSEIKFPNPSMC